MITDTNIVMNDVVGQYTTNVSVSVDDDNISVDRMVHKIINVDLYKVNVVITVTDGLINDTSIVFHP